MTHLRQSLDCFLGLVVILARLAHAIALDVAQDRRSTSAIKQKAQLAG